MSAAAVPLPVAPVPVDPAPELAELRVLLVHEWLYTWAGGERCLEQLALLMPHADILAGMVTPQARRQHEVAARARESWAGRIPGARTKHRWFLPLHAAAFAGYDTSGYDLVISISHAFEKAIRATKPGAVHLSYCLSPPRFLWTLSDAHERLATPLQRAALRVTRAPLRALDRRMALGVDRFVSLSHVVAARVRHIYRRESTVVYPPVAPKPVAAARAPRDSFLLTLGRLVPYKRVDLAIAAAERLRMPLVVAGDGPSRAALEAQAGPHTRFVGEVSEAEAGRLLERCAAFVFCAEEDFGIAPLEANAHGAPVVAFGRGGATETIRDGVTGVFFAEQSPDAVAEAITRCLAHAWDDTILRAHVERFSPARFRDGMRAEIRAALRQETAAS